MIKWIIFGVFIGLVSGFYGFLETKSVKAGVLACIFMWLISGLVISGWIALFS